MPPRARAARSAQVEKLKNEATLARLDEELNPELLYGQKIQLQARERARAAATRALGPRGTRALIPPRPPTFRSPSSHRSRADPRSRST